MINVTIIDPLGDKSWDVDLPDDAAINQLVPQLLPKLGISQQGSFTLRHKRLEKLLGPAETLRTAGVVAGDTLQIAQAPTAAK